MPQRLIGNNSGTISANRSFFLMTTYFFRVLILASALLYSSGTVTRIRAAEPAAPQRVDLLLEHGKLFDGSGGEPTVGDVGIRGDRIAFIGNAAKAGITAARVIDASGLDVAPGFIDP